MVVVAPLNSLSVKPMTDPTPITPAKTSKAALFFIYITILVDVLAFGIIIPIFPKLVAGFISDPAVGAEVYGLFGTVWAVMQFICSPLLGSLSDRFGRRPVLILSALGLGLDYIFMALAPSLALLFVGRIISGITSSSFSTAAAYVADVTPVERRAVAFGRTGAAWGLGFIIGPAIGGVLGSIGPRIPFWGAAALSLVSAGYGLLVLPESLYRERRSPFSWRRANPAGSLKLLRSNRDLFGLASVNFLNVLAFQVLPSVFVLYTGYRYQWDYTAVGFSLTLVGALNILVQGILVKPVISRFGERFALLTGLLFGAISFVAFGLAPTGVLFLVGVVLYAPIGLVGPALQGLMTRKVSQSEQGQLQGANASIMGLTGVIGPGLFTVTYALFIGSTAPLNLPGSPFLLASLLMVCSVVLALRVTQRATFTSERLTGSLHSS